MDAQDHVRDGLTAAVTGGLRGRAVADQLCAACVEFLDIDGAALSVIHDGAISRSFGASSALSRELDELQFTLGEGPCLEAVRLTSVVVADDLHAYPQDKWPAFADAAAHRGARMIVALPVAVANFAIGALDLYRARPGRPDSTMLHGGYVAAELAALPMLDMMGIDMSAAVADEASVAWEELSSLTRVEVYQAAGMLIAQLGVSPSEALIRLRAHAFAHDMTASEVAFAIIERQLRLDDDRETADENGKPGEAGEHDGP